MPGKTAAGWVGAHSRAKPTAFFDASAMAPLCLAQPSSQWARQAYRTFTTQIVAPTTLIETASAINRAVRLGGLVATRAKTAMDRLSQLERRWIQIEWTDRITSLAVDVLAKFDLRAGDAIQLASALTWCKEQPRNRAFVSFDQRLGAAAVRAGFDLISLE
jgi:predicted nucleic acid-binding protein